jgi:hypothetical protein
MTINEEIQYSNFVNENKNLGQKKNESNLFGNIIDEPITPFLYIPSPEEIMKESKPKIPIPIKLINQSYLIKKLKKLNYEKKNIYVNNNIILGQEKNTFLNFYRGDEDKIDENNYNMSYNIDKFGQNKADFFLINQIEKREKYYKSEFCKKMNKSSESLLNTKEYKIKKEKLNLDENIKKTESIGDFDINIKNQSKKNFID